MRGLIKVPCRRDALDGAGGGDGKTPNTRGEGVAHPCLIILVDACGQSVDAKVGGEVVVVVGFPK